MMPDAILYRENMPESVGVLEVAEPSGGRHWFVPLTGIHITGTIGTDRAACTVTQIFPFPGSSFDRPVFIPVPGGFHQCLMAGFPATPPLLCTPDQGAADSV